MGKRHSKGAGYDYDYKTRSRGETGRKHPNRTEYLRPSHRSWVTCVPHADSARLM